MGVVLFTRALFTRVLFIRYYSSPSKFPPLYKEGRGRGARYPNPSRHLSPSSLLRRLGEALQKFSTIITTTPSCCWDFEEDLLHPLHAGTGRGSSTSTPYV